MRLQKHLDKEVYQVICKLQDDQSLAQQLSVEAVLTAIRKSNSSLRRKPKLLLEDSISRVIEAVQDEESDSDSGSAEQVPSSENTSSQNTMNRSIVRQMKASHGQPDDTPPQTEDAGSAKRPSKSSNHNSGHERPPKRVKLPLRDLATAPPQVSLADIGGMDTVIDELKEHLMLPLKRPERYIRRGLEIPRGILLHGPSGCGKTMLCEAVAAELGLPFLAISAPSIVSGMSGESEKQLRTHFENAINLAPCLMFIDEIDAIAPKRENAQREMEKRIVCQLLTCLDSLAPAKTGGRPVIVLAATNRPDSLDPALRRPGRFDTEINIRVPSVQVREQILRTQTSKTTLAEDVDFKQLAKMTGGFVGADLKNLVYKAGTASNARYLAALKELSEQQTIDAGGDVGMAEDGPEEGPKLSQSVISWRKLNRLLDTQSEPETLKEADAITMSDFLTSFPQVLPSSKREGFATIPDTTWESIGALHDVRKQLQRAIVRPIAEPEEYARFGMAAQAGVLLYGPPGNGKTLLAKAVANESKANFISVKGPELLNKFVGESERAVRQVFLRARSSVPCVIFFDELDALTPKRDEGMSEASARVVNTLLTELDGTGESRDGIYIIAATNRPERIDSAMLRPGRLGKLLYVGLPGPNERVEILQTILRSRPCDGSGPEGQSLAEFARGLDAFSGADLESVVHEATQSALERRANSLNWSDLEKGRLEVNPSIQDSKRWAQGRLLPKN